MYNLREVLNIPRLTKESQYYTLMAYFSTFGVFLRDKQWLEIIAEINKPQSDASTYDTITEKFHHGYEEEISCMLKSLHQIKKLNDEIYYSFKFWELSENRQRKANYYYAVMKIIADCPYPTAKITLLHWAAFSTTAAYSNATVYTNTTRVFLEECSKEFKSASNIRRVMVTSHTELLPLQKKTDDAKGKPASTTPPPTEPPPENAPEPSAPSYR